MRKLTLVDGIRGTDGNLIDPAELEHWKQFGAWLKAARDAAGLNRASAARRSEASASTWANLESGGRYQYTGWMLPKPSDALLMRIARAISVDPVEVFTRAGRELTPITPEDEQSDRVDQVLTRLDDLESDFKDFDDRLETIESKIDDLARGK